MTLKEAENNEKFDGFKFMSMFSLIKFILECAEYLAKQDDAEVEEFHEAAKLIRDSRLGKK